jgi:hypothetical protein
VFADDRVGPCVWRLIHRQQLHRLARSRYWGGQRRCRAAQVMRSTQSAQRRSQPRSAYGGGTERARSPAHAPAARLPAQSRRGNRISKISIDEVQSRRRFVAQFRD